LGKITDILKMIKFSHTIFALPFAGVSFVMNQSAVPSAGKVILMILALVFARSGAMAFNRLVDLRFDKENPRTKNRELVTGTINKKETIIFITVNTLGFIGVSYFINSLCFVLSPVLLILLYSYSFWKRFSVLCHLYLGLVIGLAPVGVDLALNESVSVSSLMLLLSVGLWVFGFDILYSLLDMDHDRKMGLHSIPARYGVSTALVISKIAYVFMIGIMAFLGWIQDFGLIYYGGLLLLGGLLGLQHIWVRPNDLTRVNQAFFQLNSFVSVIYLVAVLAEIYIA